MKPKPETFPKPAIFFTFIIGVLCAAGFRSLTIIDVLYPHLVRPVWYFAVIGYIYFFAYRYHIANKRKKVITENDLLSKLRQDKEITKEDKEFISYILASLIRSKESINYFFIFIMSIVAILLDIFISK
ncbi:MAG: hypothetical protein JSW40_08155 [Candidatus Omnitrophota bacterium]|nr:MAG: hypothetical protein JSW40_08155 [Candidatus Omnitrophota bacterium]